MRNRIDLRTLFQSLEDPAVPAGLTERIMRQVAAAGRPATAPVPARLLPFEIPLWARLPLAASAATAVLLFAGAAWMAPSSWLGLLDGLRVSLFGAVWLVTQAAAILAESVVFLKGAARVGEALDLVLNTPAAMVAIAVVTLLCLTGVHLLHRLSRAPVRRPRGRGFRAGALLVAFGLCCTGLAFGQPGQEEEERPAREESREGARDEAREESREGARDEAREESREGARDEAASVIEEAREQLDEALEEAGERAQGAVQDALERIDDLERDLAEAGGRAGDRRPVVRVDLDNKVAFGSTVRVGRDEVAHDAISIGGGIKVDGEVRGDAVAIGGEAKIDGRVTGDVVAVGGDVELGPEAEVLGDIVTVGGRVSREDGAAVLGEISEVDWGNFDWDWKGNWLDGWSGEWFPRVGRPPPVLPRRQDVPARTGDRLHRTAHRARRPGSARDAPGRGPGAGRRGVGSVDHARCRLRHRSAHPSGPDRGQHPPRRDRDRHSGRHPPLARGAGRPGARPRVRLHRGGGGGRRLVPQPLQGRQRNRGRELRRHRPRRTHDPGAGPHGRPARLSRPAVVLSASCSAFPAP